MSIHYMEMTTEPQTCRNCGGVIEPGWGQRVEEWDYDWDNPDENAQGSIQVKTSEWYQCALGAECIETACKSGYNLQFLRDIATGKIKGENGRDPLPENWRTMARNAHNGFSRQNRELAYGIAAQADGAMREAGFGAIGGGRGY